MTTALFVVSEEGYWGEECVDPLQTLSDAGVDIDVATPSGSKAVVDQRSIDPENVGEETAERVRDVHENDERMKNPIPLANVDSDMYDAVVFPGGHGTEWDVNQDRHARRLLRNTVEGEGGKALVVCHAVGLLAFTRDGDGEFLVEGRDVTGFPNDWEEDIVDEHDCMPDGRKLPYYVEDEVSAAGGNWDAELNAETSVRVDGDLLTARGPESSHDAATTLLEALGVK
ncbi:type 1 glutamine amidotransferase domain-containing protein [Haladaptatus halobius]|uniref:type 1 glutamine amidotransferase domain-containing protein n=1 Tax=Haladaptatus halobius TaxID=2884875 RepID=UPI001D0A1406|nr:type 1 glutamine amidotransferase domain-containing protein [Haladaptatus halobius]